MRVKPVDPKSIIRDPVTLRPLPAEGGDVPDNIFWQRRLLDGSVVLDKSPAPAPAAPASTSAAPAPSSAPASTPARS